MNEKEIENLKIEEETNNSMNEKVHYEIKFVETDDGYRLEASGDKDALRRLGIGPNMVDRKRRRGGRGRRGRRAGMARRRMNHARRSAGRGRSGFGPRPFPGARRHWHAMADHECHPGMPAAEEWQDPRGSWDE